MTRGLDPTRIWRYRCTSCGYTVAAPRGSYRCPICRNGNAPREMRRLKRGEA